MGMSNNVGDREKDKFRELSNGKTVVAIKLEGEVDEDGDKQEIREDGHSFVADPDSTKILQMILFEIKKMNTHLALMTEYDNDDDSRLDQC